MVLVEHILQRAAAALLIEPLVDLLDVVLFFSVQMRRPGRGWFLRATHSCLDLPQEQLAPADQMHDDILEAPLAGHAWQLHPPFADLRHQRIPLRTLVPDELDQRGLVRWYCHSIAPSPAKILRWSVARKVKQGQQYTTT